MGEIMMFKIVNADVNLKGHKERSEFMAHFKLQSVLLIQITIRILICYL
jgi:hypothetical protein